MKKAILFLIIQCIFVALHAQINTDRVLAIGRNALYFEDYVLSIQYFNQVIKAKPWLAEPYFYRAVAKINLDDYNPDKAYMYSNNCLFFDNETNELYFRMYTYYGRHYELLKIDKNTGHCTHVSDLPYATSGYTITTAGDFDGIVIPYIAAEASAPAKVQNLKVTPGANGALSATVSWTNPSKTFGRGGTLEDLDSVVVFRDGVEVACFDNPVIGGEQTWTDNTLTARGYYSYKIIPYNDMGRGDRTSAAAFIGPDNPKAPADVQLVADGNDGVLSWTAPTKGKTGGYINTADLKYDILRLPDSVKVATDYAGTNFTDDNITRMNRYTYSIIAKAGGYSSEKAVSNEEILGPAFEVPDTLMNSKENFNLGCCSLFVFYFVFNFVSLDFQISDSLMHCIDTRCNCF